MSRCLYKHLSNGASRAKSIEVVHDVTTVESTGVRNFWVRDNAGNLIEFNQWLRV